MAAKRSQKEHLETWIACDRCNGWVVPEGNVPPEYLSNKIKFTCKTCVHIEQLVQEMTTMRKELSYLKQDLKTSEITRTAKEFDIRTDIEANVMKSWSEVVSSNATSAAAQSIPLSARQIKQAADEIDDLKKRKLNLIVAGLPEHEHEDDVTQIITYANIKCNPSVKIQKQDITVAERLGTNSGRPRLLRIQMASSASRRALLTMRRSTSTAQPPSSTQHSSPCAILTETSQPVGSNGPNISSCTVYFRPDLTRLQQEADKKLREELLNKGKDKFKIHPGVIVPREVINENIVSRNTERTVPTAPRLNPISEHSHVDSNSTEISSHTISAFGKEADLAAAKAMKHKAKKSAKKGIKESVKCIPSDDVPSSNTRDPNLNSTPVLNLPTTDCSNDLPESKSEKVISDCSEHTSQQKSMTELNQNPNQTPENPVRTNQNSSSTPKALSTSSKTISIIPTSIIPRRVSVSTTPVAPSTIPRPISITPRVTPASKGIKTYDNISKSNSNKKTTFSTINDVTTNVNKVTNQRKSGRMTKLTTKFTRPATYIMTSYVECKRTTL